MSLLCTRHYCCEEQKNSWSDSSTRLIEKYFYDWICCLQDVIVAKNKERNSNIQSTKYMISLSLIQTLVKQSSAKLILWNVYKKKYPTHIHAREQNHEFNIQTFSKDSPPHLICLYRRVNVLTWTVVNWLLNVVVMYMYVVCSLCVVHLPAY